LYDWAFLLAFFLAYVPHTAVISKSGKRWDEFHRPIHLPVFLPLAQELEDA
jgi:hypothetical protein